MTVRLADASGEGSNKRIKTKNEDKIAAKAKCLFG